jgi:hypothetical protein
MARRVDHCAALHILHPPFSGTLRNDKSFYIQDKASPGRSGGHLHEKA